MVTCSCKRYWEIYYCSMYKVTPNKIEVLVLKRREEWIPIGNRHSWPQAQYYGVKNSHLGSQRRIPRGNDFCTHPSSPWLRITCIYVCLPHNTVSPESRHSVLFISITSQRGAFYRTEPQFIFDELRWRRWSFWRGRGEGVSALLKLLLSFIFREKNASGFISQRELTKITLWNICNLVTIKMSSY